MQVSPFWWYFVDKKYCKNLFLKLAKASSHKHKSSEKDENILSDLLELKPLVTSINDHFHEGFTYRYILSSDTLATLDNAAFHDYSSVIFIMTVNTVTLEQQ